MSENVFRKASESVAQDSAGKTATARCLTLAAAAATLPVATQSTVEAADFFNSGPITSNNTVGWVNGTSFSSNVNLSLTNGQIAYFAQQSNGTITTSGTGYVRLRTLALGLNFVARTSSNPFAKTVSPGQKWTTVTGGSNGFAWPGAAYAKNGGANLTGNGLNSTDAYLLFKFTDNAEDYYGWIQVAGESGWVGSNINVYVTVKSYAWQKGSIGILGAGVAAVPEPSTMVTSGIAALAGGATALRRWRRERKKASTVA